MENLPKNSSSKPRRLGKDPFGDVSELIDEIISGDDVAPAKSPEQPVEQRAEERSRHEVQEPMNTQTVFCPHVGVEDDPTMHLPTPASTHRCFAGERVLPILAAHQLRYCLSANYSSCAVHPITEQRTQPADDGNAKKGKRLGFLQRLLRRE